MHVVLAAPDLYSSFNMAALKRLFLVKYKATFTLKKRIIKKIQEFMKKTSKTPGSSLCP